MARRRLSRGLYILRGHTPVEEPDLLKWAEWFETADRHVADTRHELFRVSTVFLGLDHRFDRGPPLLFETMVFLLVGDPNAEDILERADESIDCVQYANWEDAEIGHKAMVRRMIERVVKAEMKHAP